MRFLNPSQYMISGHRLTSRSCLPERVIPHRARNRASLRFLASHLTVSESKHCQNVFNTTRYIKPRKKKHRSANHSTVLFRAFSITGTDMLECTSSDETTTVSNYRQFKGNVGYKFWPFVPDKCSLARLFALGVSDGLYLIF